MALIHCRARVHPNCDHGRPADPDGDPWWMDGTYDVDSNTIVCDWCYVRLMPYTPSGRGLNAELHDAIIRCRLDQIHPTRQPPEAA